MKSLIWCVLTVGCLGAMILLAHTNLSARAEPGAPQETETRQVSAAPPLLTPDEMERRVAKIGSRRADPLEVPAPAASAGSERYGDIRGDAIHGYLRDIVEFSQQSKRNGDVLWGRLHGSVHERGATEYVRDQFKSWGLENVQIQPFTAQDPRWVPQQIALRVRAGSDGAPPAKSVTLRSAITAYASGVTPAEGITAPIEYVGMASPAELRGRDLAGKIALVYVRVWNGPLFHTGHLAIARLAEETAAAGVILWLDQPGNAKVAAQLWNPKTGESFTGIPWVNIGFYDGVYLRKLIERTDPANPPRVTLTVTGEMVRDLKSQNLIAEVPGTTDENILLTAHIDGFFNAAQDTGAGVAGLMELARYYNGLPREERRRNLVFVVTGDHEHDGMAGLQHFARGNPDLLAKTVAVLQLEKIISPATTQLFSSEMLANTHAPRTLFVSNGSTALVEAFTSAAKDYNINMITALQREYLGDVEALYGTGVPAAGWIEVSFPYHNEDDSPELFSENGLQDITRAYASVIDRIGEHTREELNPETTKTLGARYFSDDLVFQLSMW